MCIAGAAGSRVCAVPETGWLQGGTAPLLLTCSPPLPPTPALHRLCSANELPSPVVTLELPRYASYSTPVVKHTLQPRWGQPAAAPRQRLCCRASSSRTPVRLCSVPHVLLRHGSPPPPPPRPHTHTHHHHPPPLRSLAAPLPACLPACRWDGSVRHVFSRVDPAESALAVSLFDQRGGFRNEQRLLGKVRGGSRARGGPQPRWAPHTQPSSSSDCAVALDNPGSMSAAGKAGNDVQPFWSPRSTDQLSTLAACRPRCTAPTSRATSRRTCGCRCRAPARARRQRWRTRSSRTCRWGAEGGTNRMCLGWAWWRMELSDLLVG